MLYLELWLIKIDSTCKRIIYIDRDFIYMVCLYTEA